MDCVSVISLTSTSSSSSSESLASVLTVSSETQRVPVSWEHNKKKKDDIIVLNQTPSHSEKVNNWMKSWENQSENSISPDNGDKQTSTCIRYDFDKSPRAASIPKSCYTRTTPLFSYIEEAKKNNSVKVSRETRAKSVDSHMFNGDNLPKNNGNTNTLSSPNSKKKEFCSYLQLAKPDDEPERFFIEHRRSCRVKNQVVSNKNVKRTKKSENNKKKKDEDSSEKNNYPTLKSFRDLKMKTSKLGKVFNLKRKFSVKEMPKSYLPLPPKRIYSETCDFEDAMKDFCHKELKEKEKMIIEQMEKEEIKEKVDVKKKNRNGRMKIVEKRRRFKIGLKKYKKGNFISKRVLSLRSDKRLRNVSLDASVLKKKKKRGRKKLSEIEKTKPVEEKFEVEASSSLHVDTNVTLVESSNNENQDDETTTTGKKVMNCNNNESPRCEIVSVHTNSDDENIDVKNFVDDMLELDKMSEEHRKSVIESRILASTAIANLISKKSPQQGNVQKALKIFCEISNERKNLEEGEDENVKEPDDKQGEIADLIITEHDYANFEVEITAEECEEDDDNHSCGSLSPVPIQNREVCPVREVTNVQSLHRSLTFKRKSILNKHGLHNWTSSSNPDRKLNHSISISNKDGDILRACYQEYNLVIVQQNSISFWTQSALGNVLGAQNMWIPKGQIKRIPLNSTYIQKNAMEMVITTETSIAYIELWTKEHKSELREVPVADVFATVYFWRLRQSGLDKKALQLENIKGFADDVQYCVLKCYPRIIVSWHSVQGNEKKTKIRSYHLAADFQTVANVNEIQPVEHFVSSLHNIEDCDNLIMGCGDNKVTLWNVEYGNIVATIETSNITPPLSTLWVQCDRGFLFTIQECVGQELRLIAINGMNHSWKKLQSYTAAPGFDCLKGVCIQNGILVAYYTQGILCWNAQTGELIVEEVANEGEYIPSGKHVIMLVNENIIVRHSLSHLITDL